MKKILIVRGGNTDPIILNNGDKYDSYIEVYKEDCTIELTVPHVNTDFTNLYNGGILSEGIYAGIVGKHKGKKAINVFDFNAIDKVMEPSDLTEKNRTLPSLIKNPNNNMLPVIKYINIHQGGTEWDWSHGCITIYHNVWNDFINLFKNNDKVVIEIIRREGWSVPNFYQGR